MENAIQNQTEIVISRTFNAPRERVWKFWTKPELMKKWFGPEGYTCPEVRIDLRVGGKSVNCMRSPEGKDFWSTGEYIEIIPNEKIVTTDSFADEKGNPVSATHYGMPSDFPFEMMLEITFKEKDGKTEMNLRHSGLPEGKMAEQTKGGWNQSFDKMERELKKG